MARLHIAAAVAFLLGADALGFGGLGFGGLGFGGLGSGGLGSGPGIRLIGLLGGSGSAFAQEQEGGTSGGSGAGGDGLGSSGPGNGGLGNGGSGFGAPASGGAPSDVIEAPSPESLEEAPAGEESAAPENAEDGLQAAPEGLAAAPMALTAEESNPIDALSAGAKATVPNIAGTGSLSTSVQIQVPAFRGLEPDIALSYDSSRKTRLSALYQGWLGYAWGLDGFDVIERASPGYGVPSFDATDVYLFNGSQLVACGSGVASPSCSTGGTHATENESWRRVAFNGGANEWKVTDRDGTVSTFKSVAVLGGLSPASGTPAYDLGYNYRWLLASITDTNSNTVSFTYSCPASPVCYPETVSYTGAEIRFYYETRPDYILMANGLDISETTKRIKSIGVKVGAAQRDVYALTYNQAPMSNASRLTKVSRYGRNATVDAAGTITGGTEKIVQQMTYQNITGSYSSVARQLLENPVASDLDADGRDEHLGTITNTTRSGRTSTDEPYKYTHKHDLYVFKFDANGLSAGVSSTLWATTITWSTDWPTTSTAMRIFPGNYIAGKKTKDIAMLRVRALKNDNTGNWQASTTKAIVQTDAALGLTSSNCIPTGFADVCAGMAAGTASEYTDRNHPQFLADMDGNGVDELRYPGFASGTGSDGYMGVADLQGNGRQRAAVQGQQWCKQG